jgi:spermidine/putrescine-binding protein
MSTIPTPTELARLMAAGRIGRRDINRILAGAGLASVTLPMVRRPAAAAGGMTVYTWSGYEVPELHQPYIDAHGGSPDFSLFADNDEAVEKVKAGFQADIAVPTGYMTGKWWDAGLIQPIDTARLSNWGDVFEELKTLKGTQMDGKQLSIPWAWGNSSVIFRTDLAPEYVGADSWMILFDEKYKGRIGARDAMDGVAIPAALALGFDPYAMTDEQIEQVRELMRKGHEVARFYWSSQSEIEQALAAGEIVAAYGWNDGYKRLKEAGVPVAYMTPKEGILTWVDAQVILAGSAADPQLVYDYLDATLSPEVGKFMIDSYGYGFANSKAFALADPAIVAGLGMANPTEVMGAGVFFEGMEGNYRTRLIQIFEEVKAGA